LWRKVCVCVRIGARNASVLFSPPSLLSLPKRTSIRMVSLAARSSGRRSALGRHRPERRDGGGGVGRETQKKQNAQRRGPLSPFSSLTDGPVVCVCPATACWLAGADVWRRRRAASSWREERGWGRGGLVERKKSHALATCPPRPSPAYLVLVGGSELDARGAQAEHPRRGTNKKKRRVWSAATLHTPSFFFSFAAPPPHPSFLTPPMLATALRGLLASPAAAPSQRAVAAVAVRGYHKNVSAQRAARRRVLPCRPSPPPRVPRARARRAG